MDQKNSLLIIGMIFLLCIPLSGCVEENDTSSDKQYFIGTWEGEINEINISYTFRTNNTFLYKIGPSQTNGTWILSNDQLTITIRDTSELFNYSFSQSYTKLTLDPVSFEFSYSLTKQ